MSSLFAPRAPSVRQEVEIRRQGDQLHFGLRKLPIGHAVSVWVHDAKPRTVTLYCNDREHHTFYEFQMENAKEMNRLIAEIMKDDRIRITLPHIQKMETKIDPLTQKPVLDLGALVAEDSELFAGYTQQRIAQLDQQRKSPQQIFDSLRQNAATSPDLEEMSLEDRISRVRHYQFPSDAAYDRVSDGFMEVFRIPDEDGKPVDQIGNLEKLNVWMNQPDSDEDQLLRCVEIYQRKVAYLSKYNKKGLRDLFFQVSKLDVFEPYLQAIFGAHYDRLSREAETRNLQRVEQRHDDRHSAAECAEQAASIRAKELDDSKQQ